MLLTDEEFDVLQDEAINVGFKCDDNYIGRYRTVGTFAIIGTEEMYRLLILNIVELIQTSALDGEVEMLEGYNNMLHLLLYANKDHLGNNYVWY